jgi:hypothetical protein
MLTRPTSDVIAFALGGHPDVPGQGRLCQEILSALLGMPIVPAPRVERLPGRNHIPEGRRPRDRKAKDQFA